MEERWSGAKDYHHPLKLWALRNKEILNPPVLCQHLHSCAVKSLDGSDVLERLRLPSVRTHVGACTDT